MDKYYEILEKYYDYKEFRTNQLEIIKTIGQKKDVLVVMPTGGGKSICFQIPALLSDGLTIVITPLISLMVDQVRELKNKHIKAAFITSFSENYEIENIYKNLSELKLLYIAPERLNNKSFLDVIKVVKISTIVVDEAHCCSTWGFDFRVSYLDISKFKQYFIYHIPIVAFTATAGKQIIDDIVNILGLKMPRIFKNSPVRDNLFYGIYKPKDKFNFLIKYLSKHKNDLVVIYTLTKLTCMELYDKLLKYNFNITYYHGSLDNEERNKNQLSFTRGNDNIIAATSAFGLGVNIKNIRHVIIYEIPLQIEDLEQEWGRAGRDGYPSNCILLYKEEDIKKAEFLINQTPNLVVKKQKYNYLKQVIKLCETKQCLHDYISTYFGFKLDKKCHNCCNCKKKLI